MIKIEGIALPVGAGEDELRRKAADLLRVRGDEIRNMEILKRSLDARKKPDLKYVYSLSCEVRKENSVLRRAGNRGVSLFCEPAYVFPEVRAPEHGMRPVIAGSGPAGLFSALLLSERGFRPVILERGDDVDTRQKKVESFWNGGALDPDSNVQFGEGGAGTFSDGKLNTMTRDPKGRGRFVLEQFVRFGASPEILYDAKPHIGTDRLRMIVKNMRKAVTDCGGEFRFRSTLTDLIIKDGRLAAVEINGKERLEAERLILAVGHSARDTYEMLLGRGIAMTQKAFAVGFRVQHPQSMIDLSQYGRERGNDLPPASYKLTARSTSGRGVYTFCMCPGGYVVNASSEEGRLAVNGMSYQNRDGINANSAVIVTVGPEDFAPYARKEDDILAGAAFQRILEEKAFRTAGGVLPVQMWEDYRNARASVSFGDVQPAVKGLYAAGDLSGLFDGEIREAFSEGITAFGRKLRGFDRPDMLICGVESRTSSPVRILRDENLEASVKGIIPCGEGAGYAGGITSAAVDGIRAAEAVSYGSAAAGR